MKKILSLIIIAAILTTVVLSMASCDVKPDIYALIESITMGNKIENPEYPGVELYAFDGELNIRINKDYQKESVPEELDFQFLGMFHEDYFLIYLKLLIDDGKDKCVLIQKKGNTLSFELNDLSIIILDLLYSAGFIDEPVRKLFDNYVEYDDGTALYFDLTDFDLNFFDIYVKEINKAFTVTSKVNYYFKYPASQFEKTIPPFLKTTDYQEPGTKSVSFCDIKTKISKELLKFPGYRYSEIFIVMETDEDQNNFIHVLAARENGETEILEKVKLDCDLSKVRENAGLIYSENIIPMRYVLELLGEKVGWNEKTGQAYITRNGKDIYFERCLINSKTYISLAQIMSNTDYILHSAAAGEYIEIMISRRY